jgi:hypothetical protein
VTPKQTEAAEPLLQDRVMRSVPFHYGWVILASGALGSFMTTPGQTYGVAPFFDPVALDDGTEPGLQAFSGAFLYFHANFEDACP